MATHHGSEGSVYVSTNLVAEVNDFTFTTAAEFAEDTNLGDTAKTFSATAITSWQGSLTCFWDETDTTGQGALDAGSSVTLNLRPEGTATGDIEWSGTALITESSVAAAKGSIVERSFAFTGTGLLVEQAQ